MPGHSPGIFHFVKAIVGGSEKAVATTVGTPNGFQSKASVAFTELRLAQVIFASHHFARSAANLTRRPTGPVAPVAPPLDGLFLSFFGLVFPHMLVPF
ncbi:MAG: hypothetical protein ACR2O2_11225 [Ruegeria sp.]